MSKQKLNGSVDSLANAFRDVVFEAVEQGVAPLASRIDSLEDTVTNLLTESEERILSKMDDKLDTTNQNVQAQLDQHRKDVKELIRRGSSE